MRADDDGIVEAFTIMRLLSSPEDDFRALVGRKFIQPLNEDLVSIILDWNEHNLIRPDRKIDSIYKDLLVKVLPDVEIVEAKPRADTGKKTAENKDIMAGRPLDDQWTAQVRLGKVSKPVSEAEASDEEEITIQPVNDDGEPLVKRKGMKRMVTEAPYPFDMEFELERLRNHPAHAFKVVGLYFRAKGFTFDNRDQFEPELARNVKVAKALKGYSGSQIKVAMDHCKNEWDSNWTLETVTRHIVETTKPDYANQ
jgi:hypothetical protein